MKRLDALILERTVLSPGYYRYQLLAPEIAALAKPGQFIQILTAAEGARDPILARPISIYRIDRTLGSIWLMVKTVGRGTRQLTARQSGEIISIWGPAGNGFSDLRAAGSVALIAGGIGMPPLFGLAEAISGKDFTLFYGGRRAADLLELDAWARLKIPVRTATDDGSHGHHGPITHLVERELATESYDYLVACGPRPMLRAVRELALKYHLAGELSLEAHMACGVGACLGCSCATAKGGYKRVCVDGPVFAVDEVCFDD